jgi:hypothetical protein
MRHPVITSWETMRHIVIENFHQAPGLPKNTKRYLSSVDDIYKSDAYHSLSIEGYNVTPALIDRVQRGDWDPDHHNDDRNRQHTTIVRVVLGVLRAILTLRRAKVHYFRIYDLRSTYATRLSAAGVADEWVTQLPAGRCQGLQEVFSDETADEARGSGKVEPDGKRTEWVLTQF